MLIALVATAGAQTVDDCAGNGAVAPIGYRGLGCAGICVYDDPNEYNDSIACDGDTGGTGSTTLTAVEDYAGGGGENSPSGAWTVTITRSAALSTIR